ncbi:hypothetical protein BGZ95_012020 [Linnemannia exigua]|uniref:Uncharacterized protein n=1 Tax=Linnemannia exigua TaxID=604196 RepID=A0AAD4D938_9FUNG|nr:hypothetical protein BGZ95_012020 [Linnemannia exigua]
MKIKILGPVLLLTLATRFARATEGDIAVEMTNNNNNDKDILNPNLATAPSAPAEQAVAVALDSQKTGGTLEVAMDGVVEAADKVFADDEDDENDEDDEEEVADADEGEDDEDEDEGEDEDEDEDEDEGEDEDEYDIAEEGEQDQDEAFADAGDDFHYADPLTVKYDAQTAQCKQAQPQQHQLQEQQQSQEQRQEKGQPEQQITFQKRDNTQEPLLLPLHEALFSSEATAEVGGACIDSFVNFALRFRERCSIKCLKTFTHVFSNPNVLGILDCFGCSNFFVSGFYALGVDCAGLFAAYPKPANATTGAGGKPGTTTINPGTTTIKPGMTTIKSGTATTTTTAAPGATNKAAVPSSKPDINPKSTNDDSSDAITTPAEDYRLGPVKPEDAALPPLDLANMLKSLGQLTSGDLQNWLDIGSDLAKVVGGGASASKGQNGRSEVGEGEGSSSKEEEAKIAAGKDLFNKFVGKAASFANWTLTPETLDQTGVFDRVHSLGLL